MPRKRFNDRSTQISTNSLLKAFPIPLSHLPKKGFNSMKLDEQRNHFRKTHLHRRCLNCNKIKKRRKNTHNQPQNTYEKRSKTLVRSTAQTHVDTRAMGTKNNPPKQQQHRFATSPALCILAVVCEGFVQTREGWWIFLSMLAFLTIVRPLVRPFSQGSYHSLAFIAKCDLRKDFP